MEERGDKINPFVTSWKKQNHKTSDHTRALYRDICFLNLAEFNVSKTPAIALVRSNCNSTTRWLIQIAIKLLVPVFLDMRQVHVIVPQLTISSIHSFSNILLDRNSHLVLHNDNTHYLIELLHPIVIAFVEILLKPI